MGVQHAQGLQSNMTTMGIKFQHMDVGEHSDHYNEYPDKKRRLDTGTHALGGPCKNKRSRWPSVSQREGPQRNQTCQ